MWAYFAFAAILFIICIFMHVKYMKDYGPNKKTVTDGLDESLVGDSQPVHSSQDTDGITPDIVKPIENQDQIVDD